MSLSGLITALATPFRADGALDPDGWQRLLHLQLQTYAASAEPAVRDAARQGFAALFDLVRRESGADDEALQAWFGFGMLMNVLASIGAEQVDAPWTRALLGDKAC